MSNQKTSQLRRLESTSIAHGDLLPIVDVSEVTSPTGETKYTTAADFATFVVSGGFLDIAPPYQGLQYANGLAFDESVTPANDSQRAVGNISSIGSQFSVFVRGYVPSDHTPVGNDRVLFGVAASTTPAVSAQNNVAYIGITGNSLFARIQDSVGVPYYIEATNFFLSNSERAFVAGLTKDGSGTFTFFINGVAYASASTGIGTVLNTKVLMGNGSGWNNIKCTIYDGHIFNRSLSASEVKNMFYRGIDTTDSGLVSSFNGHTLNAGPTQWLDSVSSHHILLPTTGARATNPEKRFILSFPIDGTSQYLGNGTERDVLPEKYVLTSCIVESNGKPLLSVGTKNIASFPSASGTGSFYDNRVALVSASYGVNPIGLLALGVAHADRSIYVHFAANAAPCTFSFDGYVRN